MSKLQDLKFWAAQEFLWLQKNEKVVKSLNNERLVKTNEKLKDAMTKMIGRSFGLLSNFEQFHNQLNQVEKIYQNTSFKNKRDEQNFKLLLDQLNEKDTTLRDKMKETEEKYQTLNMRKTTFIKKIEIAKRIKNCGPRISL